MFCNDEVFYLLNENLKVQTLLINELEENRRLSDELIEILKKRELEINRELLDVKNELFSLKRTSEIIKKFN